MTDKRLVVLVGATGSGKTDLSIRLAKHYRAPILSTDSRQVYRGMPIGTAQPTNEQLKAIEHHFIATLDIQQDFNCGQYEVQALELLRQLFVRHDTVIAVGGSGLYVKALCEGMDDLPEADPELRRTLRQRLANEGLESLGEELKRLDPVYYAQVPIRNSGQSPDANGTSESLKSEPTFPVPNSTGESIAAWTKCWQKDWRSKPVGSIPTNT